MLRSDLWKIELGRNAIYFYLETHPLLFARVFLRSRVERIRTRNRSMAERIALTISVDHSLGYFSKGTDFLLHRTKPCTISEYGKEVNKYADLKLNLTFIKKKLI